MSEGKKPWTLADAIKKSKEYGGGKPLHELYEAKLEQATQDYCKDIDRKDAEIERLKEQVKAAFFRGSDFTSSYHSVQTPFHIIEEAFSEFELEQAPETSKE